MMIRNFIASVVLSATLVLENLLGIVSPSVSVTAIDDYVDAGSDVHFAVSYSAETMPLANSIEAKGFTYQGLSVEQIDDKTYMYTFSGITALDGETDCSITVTSKDIYDKHGILRIPAVNASSEVFHISPSVSLSLEQDDGETVRIIAQYQKGSSPIAIITLSTGGLVPKNMTYASAEIIESGADQRTIVLSGVKREKDAMLIINGSSCMDYSGGLCSSAKIAL